ncbi:MYB family transcription factor [Klebsormidium nitens]|uniref:MYB family transcription factor n=1 Tax=Klebsormidium nitens TaxID=105231 RepID=A0A1Y1IMZ7_KLENI|nr:MYB family transcription factor [Klebsormidium nitens]|eukprot:GAQ91482.1 MYB family transcription factor [Klebsormidium nitens]
MNPRRPASTSLPDTMAYYMYQDTSAKGLQPQLQQFQPAAIQLTVAQVKSAEDAPLGKDGKIPVIWSTEEDEQLRDLVGKYGTQKWAAIAGKMAEKTSKQCRRRWQIIMNLIGKKGGWSEEEDRLLLEGHRNYGNRWTEIAKLVPGRTDNAVKNRYCALAKKIAEGDKPGKRKRRKRATIEHKAPEGVVAPYPGAIIVKTKLEPKVTPQEGGAQRIQNGGVKRKGPTAYERQRSSESFAERDGNPFSMHWQAAGSSGGDNSGRYRPPQSAEQRTQALVAELFGGGHMSQGMEASEGNFVSEGELPGGAYQRLLFVGDGNDPRGNGHSNERRSSHHSSYYPSEHYGARGEVPDSATWYADEAAHGAYPEYHQGFHPGGANRSTPPGSARAHKRGRMLTSEELHQHQQRQNGLHRAASQFNVNARVIYGTPEGGRPKVASRPPSSKSGSPGGKGSRSYPTQLQHALASIQRAKAQKTSPGRLATEQASRVKRKYTKREGGLKIALPEDALLTRVHKVPRDTEMAVGLLAAEMQHQPKRTRPSLSIHIPKTSGSNPSSPHEGKQPGARPLSSTRVGPSRLNPETLHKLAQHGVRPRVPSAMRRTALAMERGMDSRELARSNAHRQAQSQNDMQEIISWMSTPKSKSYFHQYITPGFEASPTFVGSGISSAPPSLNLTPTSACAPADAAKGLAWEDRFWGASRRSTAGGHFLADDSDGVLLYTDRNVDPPCFRLSPLAFQHEGSPGLNSPGMIPSLPRSPTVGALPLPKPSLPKLNTPGNSPMTTPKLLSVFSPMLGAYGLTPRKLFFEPGGYCFDDMANEIGLSPRITELTDEAPDLATSAPIDTSFTFPSVSQGEQSDRVKGYSKRTEEKVKGDGKERFDTRNSDVREGSPAQGLVSESMPGLLALPEVADEAAEDARQGGDGPAISPGMLTYSGLLSPAIPMSTRVKGSPLSRSTLLSLTPRGDALASPGFPDGEDDFFFAFSQNMSPLHSPRFLSPVASPIARAVLAASPRSPFKAPGATWRSGITSPISSFLSRTTQPHQDD